MIELTEEQIRAMAKSSGPLQLANPETGEIYFLIRQDVYELTCNIVGGGAGRVWDDEADEDLIRKKS